jgi:hypothetical protein
MSAANCAAWQIHSVQFAALIAPYIFVILTLSLSKGRNLLFRWLNQNRKADPSLWLRMTDK